MVTLTEKRSPKSGNVFLFVHYALRMYNQDQGIFSLKKIKKVDEKFRLVWLYMCNNFNKQSYGTQKL